MNEGQKLRKPDTLIVEVEILEEDSGVTNLEFETECISGRDIDNKSRVFRRFSAKGYSYRDHPDKRDSRERTEEFFDQPLKTGKYEFRIPIPETVKNGDYAVYITEIWDAEDNRRLCYSMQESITAKFSVSADAPVSVEVLSTDENMLSAIARIGEGESGVILFDGDEDPILPREALDQIAGKDKTLICDFGEYQWVVDGIDLRADKTADIDLTSEIRETELKTIKNPQKVLKVSLAEEKELPAAVQLRIKTSFVKNHFDLERGLLLYSVQAKADGGAGYETVPRKESNIQVAADNGEFWCLMDLGKGGEYFLAKEAVEMLTVDDITVAECPEFVYNGEPVCPQPQIGLNGRSMVLGQDYSLSYHNNTMSGTATMILECIGDYAHLGSNEISFVINPAAPVIRIARGGIRCARVKWEKSPEKVDGYEVQISESAEMESPRTVSLRRRRAKTLRKLNGDETYYVRIRAWKKVENKVYYSAWTSAEAITTK